MFASKILILLLFGCTIADITSPCGDWTAYKDEKCFKVFDSVAPEATAETICRGKDNDSVLGIINTSEEQDFIEKYLKASKVEDNVWIGIKKTNNSFKWLDGTDVKYSNWAKERPLKSSNDLNCAEIWVDEINYGKWMDDKCGRKNAILCGKIQPWSFTRLQSILLETRRELDSLKLKTISSQQKLIDSQKSELNNQQKLITEHKNELDVLKQKTIPAQQKQIDSLNANPVPIGFIYVQLSGQSEPNTLWPNTNWQNISPKYSGLFFRAEGGHSSAFGQIQEQQTISLNLFSKKYEYPKEDCQNQLLNIIETEKNCYLYTGNDEGRPIGIKFKHGNEEIRPRNQAIHIWQRTK